MEKPRLHPENLQVTSFDVSADYSRYDIFRPETSSPTQETNCVICSPSDPC